MGGRTDGRCGIVIIVIIVIVIIIIIIICCATATVGGIILTLTTTPSPSPYQGTDYVERLESNRDRLKMRQESYAATANSAGI